MNAPETKPFGLESMSLETLGRFINLELKALESLTAKPNPTIDEMFEIIERDVWLKELRGEVLRRYVPDNRQPHDVQVMCSHCGDVAIYPEESLIIGCPNCGEQDYIFY